MIHVSDLAAPESGGTRLSKTDWLDIAVWGEIDQAFNLKPEVKGLLAKAVSLAAGSRSKAEIVLIGAGMLPHGRRYFGAGAERVFLYDHAALTTRLIEADALLLAHFVQEYKPSLLMALESSHASAVFAQLAEQLGIPWLTLDCDFTLQNNRDLVVPAGASVSSSAAGNIQDHRPQIVLIRPGVFAGEYRGGKRFGELAVCEIPAAAIAFHA